MEPIELMACTDCLFHIANDEEAPASFKYPEGTAIVTLGVMNHEADCDRELGCTCGAEDPEFTYYNQCQFCDSSLGGEFYPLTGWTE